MVKFLTRFSFLVACAGVAAGWFLLLTQPDNNLAVWSSFGLCVLGLAVVFFVEYQEK